jgi:ATP synthase protein I
MEQQDDKLFENERSILRRIAPFLTLGIQLALSIVLFFFLGKWMDARFNTSPWLMLGGLVAGGVGGMVKFISSVMKLGQQQDALDAERKRQKKV